METPPCCYPALVLSGGGARGAYATGIMLGLVEALGLRGSDEAPFRIFTGNSVGAVNAAALASAAHRGDMGVQDLVRVWTRLHLWQDMSFDLLGFFGWPHRWRPWRRPRSLDPARVGPRYGRSLVDPIPFEHIVRRAIDWQALRANVRDGTVIAMVVTALEVATGRTTMFADLAPGARFLAPPERHRMVRLTEVTADHILASAAIPVLFPARAIGNAYYCDGGLRFNTPISPAIRAGADRLLVVVLEHESETVRRSTPREVEAGMRQYPSINYLAGKLLNALLLEPVIYDLQLLTRLNQLMEVLEAGLSPENLAHVQELLLQTRGLPYRRIDTLVFTPSRNLGRLAAAYLRAEGRRKTHRSVATWLFGRSNIDMDEEWEADLASYLLFDGGFATQLIELGRMDALNRTAEIREFVERDSHASAAVSGGRS